MKITVRYSQSLASALLISGLLIGGCATTQPQPQPEEEVASIPTAEVEPLSVTPVETQSEAPTEESVVSRLMDKLRNSTMSLFWREKNAYSYYVGKTGAEYVPGDGLTVEGNVADGAVECHFSEDGNFKGEDPAKKKACEEIMFSLDVDLSE